MKVAMTIYGGTEIQTMEFHEELLIQTLKFPNIRVHYRKLYMWRTCFYE